MIYSPARALVNSSLLVRMKIHRKFSKRWLNFDFLFVLKLPLALAHTRFMDIKVLDRDRFMAGSVWFIIPRSFLREMLIH